MKHPLPEGTRVHHMNQPWSYGFTEEERQAKPSWGWATVLSVHFGPYPDGSYEYDIRYDKPLSPGGTREGQWASYHIDQAEEVKV
jgi:hypothetical protein